MSVNLAERRLDTKKRPFVQRSTLDLQKRGVVDTNLRFLDKIRFLQVKKVILGELEGKGIKVWEMSVIYE